ncbi:mitochondrial peripheral inner membrane protein [Exophiala xenobiotica]|uniref:Mitochondrial peripheral inner membrane protein n=1 Tax=Lithohypha guttulata TaxID=1690604 RepID=A0ABR0KIJ9_9EURO|nr:mitochondrial peripheral inner membrane protein [Lithohypha guttulata]KAK5325224.1 mitochondrial peripheral inner membrane protein [Exophiala xenobiotica]
MFRRCIARPSICTRLHPHPPWPLPSATIRPRLQSTAPEQKPPTRGKWEKPPTSRKWHLYVVIGLISFTVGSWYRILVLNNRKEDPTSFKTFKLISKEEVSSTASIFTIKPQTERQLVSTEAWKQGIWNVEFKQPQLQIVRPYTPLPPALADELDTDVPEELRFLIRKDARGGEMSSYLHRLPLGSTIELRGPNIEYPYTALGKDVKSVIFIAGGTGIAPAMQLAHAMFDGLNERQKKEKALHILWANRSREDCAGGGSDGPAAATHTTPKAASNSWSWTSILSLLAKIANDTVAEVEKVQVQPNAIIYQLNSLKSQSSERISLSYFVDEEKTYIHTGTIEDALSSIKAATGQEKTQIIISGPPGFITYLAGPKVWQDGKEKQGPLGGRLAQVLGKEGRDDVKVWKV